MSPTRSSANQPDTENYETTENGDFYNSTKIDTYRDVIENTETFKNFNNFLTYLCPFIGKQKIAGEIMTYQIMYSLFKEDISKIGVFNDSFMTIKAMNIARLNNKFKNIIVKFPELDTNPEEPSCFIKVMSTDYNKNMLDFIRKEFSTEIIT